MTVELDKLDEMLKNLDEKLFQLSKTLSVAAGGFKVGQRVSWQGGTQFNEGTIRAIYTKTVTKTLGGVKVTKNGSPSNPVLFVSEDEDGQKHLLMASQVSPAT